MRDPTDLKTQEREKRAAEHERKQRIEQVRSDLIEVMSEPHGRRFVWRQLETAGIFRTSFTGNSETFFREGARNHGLVLFNEIHEHCPEFYTLMVSEQREYAKRNADHQSTER